jgi:Transposase DDE domain/Transposase domain (DUF772)
VLGRVDPRGSLLEPGLLLEGVVSWGSFYDRLAEVGPDLIRDEDFARMYDPGRGRPSIPPSVLMRALLLQTRDEVSDREAARRSRVDLDWKHALGLEVDHPGIGATTFSLFRARVVLHDADRQLFCAVLARAVQAKLFPKRVLALIDSSPVLGAGAVADTYALVAAAIRGLVRAAGAETLSKACRRSVKRYLREGKPPIDWADASARAGELARMVAAAGRLRAAVADRALAEPKIGEADGLLAAVLDQDVAGDPDTGAPRIRRGVAKDRIVSVTDPQMRHGRKSASRRFDGHKMHVITEECTELVLAVDVGAGNGSDGDAAAEMVRQVRDQAGLAVRELVGDMAYGDGDTRSEVEAAGTKMIAKVPPTPPNAGRFTKDAFAIDLADPDRPTATCPAGQVSDRLLANGHDPHGRPEQMFVFDAQTCAACPLRDQCVRGRGGRTLALHRHEARLQQARADQRRPAVKRKLRKRAKIERKIDHLQDHGMRKARYRGRRKTTMQALLAAVVVNMKRIDLLGGFDNPATQPTAA